MIRVFFTITAALVAMMLSIIVLALVIGRGVPQAWQIIYARREPPGHWTLHIADTVRGVTRAFQPEYTFSNEPHLSPDHRFVLWQEADSLRLLDFHTRTISDFSAGYAPVWSPDGRGVAYVSGGDIYVTTVDDSGTPSERIRLTPTRSDASRPRWSPDGEWLAFQNYRNNHQQIFIVRRNGADLRQIDINGDDVEISPAWSPDGERLAFAARVDDNLDIYVTTWSNGVLHRISTDPAVDFAPLWSPDGRYLLFASNRRYIEELHIAVPSTDAPPQALDEIAVVANGIRWSPDSRSVVFVSRENGELYRLDIEGGTMRQLTDEQTSHRLP